MAVQTKPKKTTQVAKTVKTVKVAVKPKSLTLPHFTITGTTGSAVPVPKLISEKVSLSLLAQVVRVYQLRNRQGTQSTKTRSEVTGSTRKIYRQKGTGRARHGDIKAPTFVGGGIVFGPKPRDFNQVVPQKMRHSALLAILADKMTNGQTSVVSGLANVSGKTKDMVALFSKMNVANKKLLVVVTPAMNKAVHAIRNIDQVELRRVDSLSALDALKSEHIIFAEEALNLVK